MKKLLLIASLFISLISCSQESKPKTMNIEITANTIVEKISKEVKHYPKEPVYQLYVNNSLCLYEVLVNDYPVGKMFEYEQEATPYEINDAILKSGKHILRYRALNKRTRNDRPSIRIHTATETVVYLFAFSEMRSSWTSRILRIIG